MRRVPIRMKLGATLLVPVLGLVAVAGVEMATTAAEVDEVHDQAELATASLGPPSLLIQIERERNAVATYILGQEEAVALSIESTEEAYANTDRAAEDFRDAIGGRGDDLAETYAPAFEALESLDGIRDRFDAYEGPRSLDANPFARELFDGYTAIMDAVFAANAQVTPTIENEQLRRGAELAHLSAHQSDTTARILRELLRALVEGDRDGVTTPDEIHGLARELSSLQRTAEDIDTLAQGDYRPLAEELFANDHIQRYPEIVQQALDTGQVNLGEALAASTGDESGGFGYTVFSEQVNDQLMADAEDVRAAADARLVRYGILAAAAVLLALLSTWVVSRSITRPLHALTRQAKAMAGDRLPGAVGSILATPLGDDVTMPDVEPVRVGTRDEVGDVSRALNTVQETALDLAVEQAVLRRNIADSFVNLGRRNQNLLSRQLDFITELESNETDPDTLAALFRLDHLATRMRRNAESLLVLAGIAPPRQWTAPVSLTDVIRAALGEVEDYQRVTVRDVEAATIVGTAAADLAHLIAEFVENALTFSPPEQSIEIRGRRRPDGYSLAVIDHGLGMPPDDIARANRRLAGDESFTVAPSRYLGHYVAGNLAARHDVVIRLEPSPGGGVTTSLHLPVPLLTDDHVPEGATRTTLPGAAPRPGELAVEPPPAPDLATPPLPTLNAGPPPLPFRPLPVPDLPAPGNGSADGPATPTTRGDPGDTGEPAAPAHPPPTAGQTAGQTASGLAKRPSRAPTTSPSVVPQGELLDALSQHTRQHGDAPRTADPAARAPEGPRTSEGAHGGATASGLARRVPGAHLPGEQPRRIRRDSPDPGPGGDPAAPGPATAHTTPGPSDHPDRDPAESVYTLLTNFADGVQRGLDDSTGGDAPSPPDDRHP